MLNGSYPADPAMALWLQTEDHTGRFPDRDR
jgi:hypothetical protein